MWDKTNSWKSNLFNIFFKFLQINVLLKTKQPPAPRSAGLGEERGLFPQSSLQEGVFKTFGVKRLLKICVRYWSNEDGGAPWWFIHGSKNFCATAHTTLWFYTSSERWDVVFRKAWGLCGFEGDFLLQIFFFFLLTPLTKCKKTHVQPNTNYSN